jgi:hypothetical protein
MSRKAIYPIAHQVIDLLADHETPGPAIRDPELWRKAVRNRLRTQHWDLVVAALEDNPDQAPADIAAAIRAAHPAPNATAPMAAITEWAGPEYDPADGQILDHIDAVRPKANAARAAIAAARKPPMGDPPISTRGTVTR